MSIATNIARSIAGLTAVLLAACAAGNSMPAPAGAPQPTQASSSRDVRGLTLVPRAASACPGDVITTRYDARGPDGRSGALSTADLAQYYRSATAADPRDDGSWQTDANPLASVISGFALRTVLKSDTAIHADTVVAPSYRCAKTTFGAPSSGISYVRLGVFASPFHDSIVVATLEIGEQLPAMVILGPGELRAGVIRVDASGIPGRKGAAGRRPPDTQPCENGADGEDGGEGSSGTSGGQVDIIVQSDAPWLADLVTVVNPGGRGGEGGNPGPGGRSNTAAGGRAGTCRSSPGRNGRAGRPGAPGNAGPRPRVLSVLYPLLWPGSPAWNDTQTRYGLQQLIDYTAKK